MYNDSNTIDNHSCFHNCTSMCARFVVISHSDSNAFVPSFCTSIIPIIICIHLEGGKIGMRWQSHCLNVLAQKWYIPFILSFLYLDTAMSDCKGRRNTCWSSSMSKTQRIKLWTSSLQFLPYQPQVARGDRNEE